MGHKIQRNDLNAALNHLPAHTHSLKENVQGSSHRNIRAVLGFNRRVQILGLLQCRKIVGSNECNKSWFVVLMLNTN